MRQLFWNAGADEKPGNFFTWPYLYFILCLFYKKRVHQTRSLFIASKGGWTNAVSFLAPSCAKIKFFSFLFPTDFYFPLFVQSVLSRVTHHCGDNAKVTDTGEVGKLRVLISTSNNSPPKKTCKFKQVYGRMNALPTRNAFHDRISRSNKYRVI